MSRPVERKPKPLDVAALEALALRYVERYATSCARLTRYLERKLFERGWAEEAPPPVASTVDRLAALGYVDDRLFGDARARSLSRRGFGRRRIGEALRQAGIDESLRGELVDDVDEVAVALAFARRRRLGPFGPPSPDRAGRERAMAAFIRAGHSPQLARQIVDARTESDLPS